MDGGGTFADMQEGRTKQAEVVSAHARTSPPARTSRHQSRRRAVYSPGGAARKTRDRKSTDRTRRLSSSGVRLESKSLAVFRVKKVAHAHSITERNYARLPSNNLSQTAFELWKPKENSGRQQLSGAPHATHAKSVDKTDVRRELDCTPTLERINTDYDPGSVVSTAQSNNNNRA